MPQWFIDPNVVGLAYDAAGILVFGVPAVILSTEQIASAGESFWDYDAGAKRKLVDQRLDTSQVRHFIVHTQRARWGSPLPLNCGVRRFSL